MALVILENQRTFFIQSAIEKFRSSNSLYLGIGKSTPWSNESNPDVPLNTLAERTAFFNELIYIQKSETSKIIPIVRRINWESGTQYDLFNPSLESAWTSDFYVLNVENRVYRVASKVGNSTTTTEPTGTNQGIDTGDGYTWDYLYNIDPSDASLLINEWMPVYDFNNATTEQTTDGDVRALETLGCEHLLIQSEISNPAIPVGITYRQLGILFEPIDTGSAPITGTAVPGASVDNAGMLLSVENREAANRSAGQTETFNSILRAY